MKMEHFKNKEKETVEAVVVFNCLILHLIIDRQLSVNIDFITNFGSSGEQRSRASCNLDQ